MKKIICAVVSVALAAMVAGCSLKPERKDDDKKKDETSSVVQDKDKDEDKSENSSEGEKDKQETQSVSEKETERSEDSEDLSKAEQNEEKAGGTKDISKIFPSPEDKASGLISGNENDVDAMVLQSGKDRLVTFDPDVIEADCASGENSKKLYKIKIENYDSLEGYQGSFAKEFEINGAKCLLIIGSEDTSTLEQCNNYCRAGQTVYYWGMASKIGDYIGFIPLAAGNEEMGGYYFVKPALEKMGCDVSGIGEPDSGYSELDDDDELDEPDEAQDDDYDAEYEDEDFR